VGLKLAPKAFAKFTVTSVENGKRGTEDLGQVNDVRAIVLKEKNV
jgi:hypothetical protein